MLHPLVTGQDDGSRRSRPLLRTTLGEVLRRTRLGQGRTLADVARTAKMSMQYLSEIERGRKEASSEVLAAICGALGADLPDILAEVGHELALGQRATVIRLGTAAGGRAASAAPGSRQSGSELPGSQLPPRAGGGEAVCLLAA